MHLRFYETFLYFKSINVPLNGKCVRRLITIVVEMVGDLEKAK